MGTSTEKKEAASWAKKATDAIADLMGPDSTAARIKARREAMDKAAKKTEE